MQSFVLWAHQWSQTALEPFCREGLFFYFVSLAFPWLGFSPFCPCFVTTVHSECPHGIQPPVLSLRTDDASCTSVPSPHSLKVDASVWATSQLVIFIWHDFCVFCLFVWFIGWLCCHLWFQSSPLTRLWEELLLCGNLPSQDSLPRIGLCPNPLSPFSSLFFVLHYLEEIDLHFGVSGVLCQHVYAVLWKLHHMAFWCICGGESDLPIIVLCHLMTSLYLTFLSKPHDISFPQSPQFEKGRIISILHHKSNRFIEG